MISLVSWLLIRLDKQLEVTVPDIVPELETDGIPAKGDVSNISAAEILQLEGSVQGSEGVSGFKLDHRYGCYN